MAKLAIVGRGESWRDYSGYDEDDYYGDGADYDDDVEEVNDEVEIEEIDDEVEEREVADAVPVEKDLVVKSKSEKENEVKVVDEDEEREVVNAIEEEKDLVVKLKSEKEEDNKEEVK